MRKLALEVDVILVVGAQNSSNSNRLREIAASTGPPSYLIDNAGDLRFEWLHGARAVGITAGASAPDLLVQQLMRRFEERFRIEVGTLDGVEENVHFRLPPELADRAGKIGLT